MNAIKRFIDLLKSPLIPVRLFATGDPADDFDFSWTDTEGGYYDSEGNYLGDDSAAAEAAAASHDDPSLDNDNWSEYSDDFGDVSIQTDGNGNITGTSYKDPETGEWKESDYGGDRNSAANNKKNEEAMQVFGASMTPETLAALNGANKADVSGILEEAKSGNPAAVALATAMTGTKPDEDSLKELGYTDEQVNTAMEFAEALAQAIAEGKDPNAAWKEASNKTGDPYGTNNRDRLLTGTVISTIGMVGGPILSGLVKGVSAVPALTVAGTTGAELHTLLTSNSKGGKATGTTEDKTPSSTPATSKSEPEAARSEPKSDVTITNNPFDQGEPDISIPKGPLEGTPLAGTGLPGGETNPTKEEAEDRGFENDDSGSDTMEETSQDAPTSGLGGDTFSNPNDDTGRHGWGLGEEDPNKANYDVDKWNRGMERVSTDVVSDEKCKNFIKKTFKDDPVLIKTVRIMKSL